MTHAVAVVNPRSANGSTARRWPALEQQLRAAGIACEGRFTQGPGDGTRVAAAALREGVPLILAVGGDGTINEVANGFFATDGTPIAPTATLGVLPRGTGSDFIKTMGIPRHEDMAIATLAQGHTRRLDVGFATFDGLDGQPGARVFLNVAEVGLGGAVVDRVNKTSKAFGGFLSFLVGTLATFATYRNQRVRVSFDDGEVRDGVVAGVVVGNCRYFGGGMEILPGAVPDDGRLDALIMGALTRAELYANIWQVYRGTHLRHPKLYHRVAREVHIQAPEPCLVELDGELVGRTPVHVKLIPGALAVLC
jgi:YegS/Rv2252/BmrU family lipid kinase